MMEQKTIKKKQRKRFKPVKFLIKTIRTIVAILIVGVVVLAALIFLNIIELSQIFDFLNKIKGLF